MPQFYCLITLFDTKEHKCVYDLFWVGEFPTPEEANRVARELLLSAIQTYKHKYDFNCLVPHTATQAIEDGGLSTIRQGLRPESFREWLPKAEEWQEEWRAWEEECANTPWPIPEE